MQREWRDPRDGEEWLVTLTPFGHAGRALPTAPPRPLTISFHRPGSRPLWTSYPSVSSVRELDDQQLMDLLDQAHQRGKENGHR